MLFISAFYRLEYMSLGPWHRVACWKTARYNKTLCFDPFPFPDATHQQQTEIAALAEELDALRKRVRASHSFLTLTMLYNVLEKARAGATLAPAERDVHDAGQVSILHHLHTSLDEAVAAAYGWPAHSRRPRS